MSYQAIISKIKVKEHPNADKLQLGEVFDNQVIVGLETKSGDVGVFFPCDGQLSQSFCEANDLVTRYDEQGKKIGGGYFSEKRRVKAQNFRGEKSEGFWIPIRSLEFTGHDLSKLKEGYAFTELNGIEICTKYITPATLKKGKHSPARKRNKLFLEHVDTKQFKYDIGKIKHGSLVYLSSKIHGTCLSNKARITMANGSRRKITQVREGEHVLGVNEYGNLVSSKVLKSICNGRNTNNWVYIKCTNRSGAGNSYVNIVCTKDHLVCTDIDNGLKYIEAKNLKKGMQLFAHHKQTLDLPYVQEQVLLGKLLGDGWLCKYTDTAKVEFGHKKDHKDYLLWTLKSLGELANPRIEERISGYGTEIVAAATFSSFFIYDRFKDFYDTNGKRTIPDDIKLSPIAMAFWYMDDGSLSHNDFQEDRAALATCAYSEKDCYKLMNALWGFGIETSFRNSEGRNRICLKTKSSDIFFMMITPYVPECMQYKLPECYRGFNYWIPKTSNVYRSALIKQEIIDIDYDYEYQSLKYDLTTETSNFFANLVLVHNSARYSYLMDDTHNIWWQKWLNKIGFKFKPRKEFTHLLGTRRVILSDDKPDQFYQDEFRFNHFNEIKGKLHKNEIIYGELVGFTSSGQEIMPGVSVTKIQDKDLRKQVQSIFGDTVTYHYGCQSGESKFYVYRIIHVNEDGDQVELSWPQVKRRCREAGFETVPEFGMVIYSDKGNIVRHGILNKNGLKQYVDALVNEDLQSPLDHNTLNEGVVLRIEDPDGSTYWLKDKGYVFKVLEGIVKEDENYIDIEEQQDIQ